MVRTYHKPIKPDTVLSVLRFVRREIIRDGLDGLEHIDALLRQFGCDPDALVTPYKRRNDFRKGEVRRLVLAILSKGDKRSAQVAREIMAVKPELDYDQAIQCAWKCMSRLKRQGLLTSDKMIWRLVRPRAANTPSTGG